ncbi:TetR/AcrR family transcriptional regulator [Brevibacterium sp. VCM10]|uniref:TetR/AcrR family transcriptional regulator n=1 Tax=Brevibacterium sp. VCM10 TaxID=1381751 RepID=UPI0004704AD2|nr:TetR family transcriptional regulator [Brevibacterium sp. VCM10]
MTWDTEDTKRKILAAATTEFAANGPAGTTVERIAKAAGVNKERIYNYFDSKPSLFARVLRDELAALAEAIPLTTPTPDAVSRFAGQVFDYHLEHPHLVRLLLWEGLFYADEVPEESLRRDHYQRITETFATGQADGALNATVPAGTLHFLLVALAGYWVAMPQVARMLTEADGDDDTKRASVIKAARRLAAPHPPGPSEGI